MRSLRIVLIGLVLVAAACGGTGEGPGVADTPENETVTQTTTETATETVTETATPAAASATCGDFEPESQVTDVEVLLVDSPEPGAEFPSGATVEGCTNAFEASFQWELLGDDGEVLAGDAETASCGSGCLGTFEFTVTYSVDSEQVGTLRLFTLSAEDGSVQDEEHVAVELQP